MYQLAVVGAGQLGSRHLQGLSQISSDCHIYVVDPSENSLEIARKRFSEIDSTKTKNKSVYYLNSPDDLPHELDYVVVATNADIRLQVLKELVCKHKIRSLLLEKVLFQRLEDYELAESLLEEHSIPTWVNCPRRAWGIYEQVKDFFSNEALKYFNVSGGAWGLGCNSVHFLDVITWLTNSKPSAISTSEVDNEIVASKRPGFIEFTGMITGACGDARFEVQSIANSTLSSLVTLRSETKTCIVDEEAGRAIFIQEGDTRGFELRFFDLPPVSRLSTSIAEDILSKKSSKLPTYQESKSYHLPFIRALSDFSRKFSDGFDNGCKIT
ncbi:Gfo/Idh/MocA family oxidoreductase [Chromobacterium violaceum]|uniref:Gfo/Idh/MocA family oxidoreductase n=1 Tax=Chromobacterium violaceum TaxID=536 RepID=UPI000B2F93F8|nr:Gfo/Idh/MocA family oxidoreductase [Chromobacterium violaceum]